MNLRQKNKKLKQEVELLKGTLVKSRYVCGRDNKINCIQAELMTGFEPFRLSPVIDTVKFMKDELQAMLSRELSDYIQYECVMPGGYHDELNEENFARCRGIVAKLCVVDRRK